MSADRQSAAAGRAADGDVVGGASSYFQTLRQMEALRHDNLQNQQTSNMLQGIRRR
jgi:hypothetical protein